MESRRFEKGDIVRYTEEWSEPYERQFIFVVLETGLSFDRIKIGCLNPKNPLGYVDLVEAEMIEGVE